MNNYLGGQMEIGDRVVFPMHGAGEIIEKEKKDFDGEEVMYFTLKMNIRDLTMQFPENRIATLNIRELSTLDEILDSLEKSVEKEYTNRGNWNKRYQRHLDKLKSGDIQLITDTVVNFIFIEKRKGLSSGERQLYHNGLNLLISELMYIQDMDFDTASAFLDENIKEALCKIDFNE